MNLVSRVRSFETWYLPFVFCLWGLSPGLRRIVDWQFGRNPLSLLSVAPMLSLLPLAFIVFRNLNAPGMRLPFKTVSYLWLFGFVYALVVALSSGGRTGPLYDFALFCVPMLIGAWFIVRPASRAATFAQLSSTVLWLAAFESLYGIVQFVSPMPWDIAYMNEVNQISLGIAEPYGLHPFAMLNSHATLSVFLVVAILLNLHKIDIRRPLPLIVTLLSILVIMLTTVRSSWLALAVGVTVYVALSPKRGKTILALGGVGVLALVLLFNASALLGNSDVTTQLQSRFSTLGDIGEDESVSDRREQTLFALHEGLAEPLGQGLGTVGTSAWLSDGGGDDSKISSPILDDGYISRFLEMGVPGSIFYVATLVAGTIFGLRAFVIGMVTRNETLQQISVVALAVQVAFIGLDVSGDSHNALAGVFFWAVLGLSLRHEAGDERLRPDWEAAPPPPPTPARAHGPIWA